MPIPNRKISIPKLKAPVEYFVERSLLIFFYNSINKDCCNLKRFIFINTFISEMIAVMVLYFCAGNLVSFLMLFALTIS